MRLELAATALALAACGSHSKPDKPDKKRDAGTAVAVHDAAKLDAAPLPHLAPAPPLPAIPAGLPQPSLPAFVTPDAIALGELLFWDPRLASDGKTSCATCHDPAHGYSGATRQTTAGGKPNLRRAPTLVNLAWDRELGWDGRYASLAEHLPAHAIGQLGNDLATAVGRIANIPGYRAHFARLEKPANADTVVAALSAFVLTRYAGDSDWDRVERSVSVSSDNNDAATADLVAGYKLFANRAQCSVCHTPPLYTDLRYHRIGLVASHDEGRGRVDPAAKGAFKTPTLRGAADRTGFFHDASARTLDAAIDWHLAGGTGQGADKSIIDRELHEIALSKAERHQLGAFVRALSDSRSTTKPPARPALPR